VRNAPNRTATQRQPNTTKVLKAKHFFFIIWERLNFIVS
jgi:hypothetical protein